MSEARWVAPATFGLALAGTAISAYLTVAHYTTPTILACAHGGIVDCAHVTTSAQSSIGGMPVALLGLLWFTGMTGLCAPATWRKDNGGVRMLRVAAAVSGIGFVLWLVYAELYVVGAICLWCTAVHVVTFFLFAIIVTAKDE